MKDNIIEGVQTWTTWWISQRQKKIRDTVNQTMEINPFLAPLIWNLHGFSSGSELAEFLIGGHFYIGHGTGFGKFIDEKVLPEVFKTKKLSRKSRSLMNMTHSAYDNIDHVVEKGGKRYLLSLKAGKWTIQLGQAVNLNASLNEICKLRASDSTLFEKIIVGTFYGRSEGLTDKYRIIRGINTGQNHDVVDITDNVEVISGREFWAWLGDDYDTQDWIIEGIVRATKASAGIERKAAEDTEKIERNITKVFATIQDPHSVDDWKKFASAIND
ncbi:PmeII family type II restriction endonuclease [Agrobacterium larrymoorei]|uniref:Restriction endonuclease n=1 Tax=Agrobacterium larrymoorei TaxID=160699 RepID=A0ABU0UH52_9HYPH|nr:PmeII family type II restriction endonuclease [Agrobacterium larrymoorei]MDQ1184193.1 hypothetical protein [Agrobacterium larrymoorei]